VFVCPIIRQLPRRAAGSAAERRLGRKYRSTAGAPQHGAAARRSAANASSVTLTAVEEAEHRLVGFEKCPQ